MRSPARRWRTSGCVVRSRARATSVSAAIPPLPPPLGVAGQRGGERGPFRLVVGGRQEGGPAHADPVLERLGGQLKGRSSPVEQGLEAPRQPAPAVLLGPGDAGEARAGELVLVR